MWHRFVWPVKYRLPALFGELSMRYFDVIGDIRGQAKKLERRLQMVADQR